MFLFRKDGNNRNHGEKSEGKTRCWEKNDWTDGCNGIGQDDMLRNNQLLFFSSHQYHESEGIVSDNMLYKKSTLNNKLTHLFWEVTCEKNSLFVENIIQCINEIQNNKSMAYKINKHIRKWTITKNVYFWWLTQTKLPHKA